MRVLGWFAWLAATAVGLPACVKGNDCDFGLCGAPQVDAGGDGTDEGGSGEDGGGDVPTPPGCDPDADPREAPACVVDAYGVFVDGSAGDDAAPGTKEAPLRSLGAALSKLGGKRRIYVCEGTYDEQVLVASAVSIFGGFACGSWSPTGVSPNVAPTTPGYALEVRQVSGPVLVSDMSFTAVAGTAASTSSIAAFVSASSAVTLRRVRLAAGPGFDGKTAASGVPGTADKPLDGISGETTVPGASKTCTCSTGGITTGGAGGGVTSDGQNGGPNIPENPAGQVPPRDGKAGIGNVSCSPNGAGHNGADAASAADAPPIARLGTLTVTGWKPEPGNAAPNGAPGQGGGGGGGRGGAGGGGACGGCGGSGGQGGEGGGASIALASFDSTVTLTASTLTSTNGGSGGGGGAGGAGGSAGGGGGTIGGAPNGCPGGDGGQGGAGGAGGGGAGGLSVAVLYTGPKPTDDASGFTRAQAGAAGPGAAASNAGIPGVSADFLEATP